MSGSGAIPARCRAARRGAPPPPIVFSSSGPIFHSDATRRKISMAPALVLISCTAAGKGGWGKVRPPAAGGRRRALGMQWSPHVTLCLLSAVLPDGPRSQFGLLHPQGRSLDQSKLVSSPAPPRSRVLRPPPPSSPASRPPVALRRSGSAFGPTAPGRRRRQRRACAMAAVDVDALKEGSVAAFFELLYNVRVPLLEGCWGRCAR